MSGHKDAFRLHGSYLLSHVIGDTKSKEKVPFVSASSNITYAKL